MGFDITHLDEFTSIECFASGAEDGDLSEDRPSGAMVRGMGRRPLCVGRKANAIVPLSSGALSW